MSAHNADLVRRLRKQIKDAQEDAYLGTRPEWEAIHATLNELEAALHDGEPHA